MIVQKLEANRNAFGIFGFSFLDENSAKLRGVALDGVEPTYENIAGGKYKGSRPLFVYIKKQHVGVVPGIDKFAAEYVSQQGARRGRISGQEGPCDAAEEGARGRSQECDRHGSDAGAELLRGAPLHGKIGRPQRAVAQNRRSLSLDGLKEVERWASSTSVASYS